jgi:hypothetical protein
LIEVTISAALMAMIVVSAYVCLNAAIASQRLIEPRTEAVQNARVALALLTADLRGACPLSRDTEFLGMDRMLGEMEADNLDFATHHYTPRGPRQGDYCQISYYGAMDSESGYLSLWRRRNPTIGLDPLMGGSREEIARGMMGMRFEYYDGLDWYDTRGELNGTRKEQTSGGYRGNLSGMPDAVRITLWFDPNPRRKKETATEPDKAEPPLAFKTVVRLETPAVSRSGSSGSSPAAGVPGTSGPLPPGGTN